MSNRPSILSKLCFDVASFFSGGQLTMLKDQKHELQQQKDLLKAGKTGKIRTRKSDTLTEKSNKSIEKAEEMKKKVRK